MTKKQSVFPLLLAVMLLVMMFVFPVNKANAEENERPSLNNALLKNKPVDYTYHGDYGMGKGESRDDIPSHFIYSDELFLSDSNLLDPEIAKMSVALSILAYDQSKVCTVLRDDMEFTVYGNRKISDKTSGEAYENWSSYDTVVNNNELTIDDNDYVAYTISSKMIDDYIVYCIPIKGTSGNYEWFSNFNLGEKNDVEHRGFRIAAERVYFDLLTHFAGDGYNSKPQKRIVYFTGHSRGAAVANLLSGWLSKGKSGRYAYQNHIFGYTFACPSVSTNADTSLSNIYNFNNPGDLVTLVPNESWTEGYKRYGKTINTISTKEFDNIGTQFERISLGKKQFVSERDSSEYTDLLSQLLPTKESFYGDAAQLILNLTAFGMGKGTLEDFPAALAKSGLTVPKILIGIHSFYENPFLWASRQAVGMASDYKELIDFVESNDEAVSEMTKEEFSAFLRENRSMINRIQNAADMKIETASDFRMSLTELKLIHGGIIEIADAINKHSSLLYDENGNILDRITHGHSQITYTVWINALFYGCQGWMNYSGEAIHVLSELVVPGVSRCAPVKTVGGACFSNCSALKTLWLPDSEYIGSGVCYNDENLDVVRLGPQIPLIGENAFYNCTKLRDITMPGTAKVGYHAFANCSAIENVTLNGNGPMTDYAYNVSGSTWNYWDSAAPWKYGADKVIIGEGITSVSSRAFTQSHDGSENTIKRISLPNSLKVINEYAFYDCQAEMKLPTDLTQIKSGAFYNCKGITGDLVLSDELEIIQDNAFYGCSGLTGSLVIPETISGIPNNCFRGCSGLEALKLSNENVGIGEYAFYGCSGLSGKLVLKKGNVYRFAFKGCTSLSELVIPVGTSISTDQSFGDCKGLKKITMPADLIYHYNYYPISAYSAFDGCTSVEEIEYTKGNTGEFILGYNTSSTSGTYRASNRIECIAAGSIKKITLEEGITEICGGAFDTGYDSYIPVLKEITIPSTVEKVGSKAFYGQKNLKIEKPLTNLQTIDSYSFYDCTGLTTEMLGGLPGNLENIPESAFWGCAGLAGKLELKEGMTVGRFAFKGCTSLSELVIPVGTSIATDQSFGDCTGLKKITIPADLIYRYGTTNGYYSAFKGCSNIQEVIYTKGKTGAFLAGGNTTTQYQIEKTAAGSIEKVTLEEGITEICGGAFDTGYDSHIPVLKEITIPSTVEKVGSKAFYGQNNLKIEKPLTNLRDIGSYAFFNCQELRAIDLLGEVETIGANAFDGCTNLSHINIYSSKAPAVGSNAVLATTEVHALFNATGYDVGGWPQYHPILDLLRPIDAIGHNLNLSGSIGVNYYFHLSDEVLADEGAKTIFNLPNGLYSEKLIKDAKVQTVKGIECREFGCKLHSSQMTGNIEAIVVMSDGTESNAFPYTVKTYADVIIENKDNNASFTKVTPLIKAMLNYGGYAQQYFKYDDNPLANEDLTEEERNAIQTVTAEDVKDFERVVTGSQEDLKYEGSNLMLTSETCIRHFFTVQSGHDISEYTFKLDGKKLTPVKSGKMYYVEIPNIASGNLDKTYTVTAGGITIQYSAMSYVYTQLGKTDLDSDLANTLKALYLYNQEANAYYGR